MQSYKWMTDELRALEASFCGKHPNPEESWDGLWRRADRDLLICGSLYVWKVQKPLEGVKEVWLLPPALVTPVLETGEETYLLTSPPEYHQKFTVLPRADVIRVNKTKPSDPYERLRFYALTDPHVKSFLSLYELGASTLEESLSLMALHYYEQTKLWEQSASDLPFRFLGIPPDVFRGASDQPIVVEKKEGDKDD